MAKRRSPDVDLKRQVAQEYLAGETLYDHAKRRDILRKLIRVWVEIDYWRSRRGRPRHGFDPGI
ncbi:hypothetical protein Msil_1983 [Methylocella silvestris BL2]|uniref:Transposase n=1 Tax=Methylocella silvestris (strain DSM 15510 / CIP 108128 / LMG 27833 / NCIMB 13906 / BL2) TaxID=395965 RepID=B8EPS2_METSB|nr:hypothetical protein [Methylocella silvestris]ACK50926.1 hypothetical protein Msil_1983 [Methylocella silvestris BL2]